MEFHLGAREAKLAGDRCWLGGDRVTSRAVLEKFATMQMVDVHLPATDGCQLVLLRYTQPDPDLQLLLQQLKLNLPAQPPPRICV